MAWLLTKVRVAVMPDYCPQCGNYVRLGKGWGLSRLFCSQKCAADYSADSHRKQTHTSIIDHHGDI